MHASEIWEGHGLGPTLARAALAPLSILYAMGWEAYLAVYRLGIKRPAHPHCPILCVGNLVSGGSGKTPLTLHLIDVLRSMGHGVAVSCSGYGSPRSEAASLAPDGPLDAGEWGDEAALFRWKEPDVPMIVGRRRVLAAELCHRFHPESILLLDDGFQHLPLRKDLSIILDPMHPRNGWCLPAGPYREPRWNRARANMVLPGDFRVWEHSAGFFHPDGTKADEPGEAALLCAVGQPQNVVRSLEASDTTIVHRTLLADHDALSAGTLVSDLPANVPTVVTAKDWVKLRSRIDISERTFLILDHQVRVEPGEEFQIWLQSKLDGVKKANLSR